MKKFDLAIVGGGVAGISAAIEADKKGLKVVLIEQEKTFGGILNQCVHRGFMGNLTGIELSEKLNLDLKKSRVLSLPNTTVLNINKDKTLKTDKLLIGFDRLILAAGCTEKTIGSLFISGTRPTGIFTAGEVQKLVNIDQKDIPEEILILGSGDIGQIVAAHLWDKGKKVKIIEQNSFLGGIHRNQKKYVEEKNIPVIFNSTIEKIEGYPALTGIWIKNKLTGEKSYLPCKTLITAIGLLPDKSLLENFDTLPDWITPLGNCDYVHEIADKIIAEAENLFKK